LLLKYLQRAGHNVFLCTNDGDSFDRIIYTGIPVFMDLSLSKKSSFLKSSKYITGLVNENKIDIIHSHHRYYELLANSINKKKKVRTVFTALSIVDKRYFVEYKSDKIIAVSNCVKDMLIDKFNVDVNKISLIPNFVDSEEINVKRQTSNVKQEPGIENRESEIIKRESETGSRESETVNILSVGRFHKEKNYETLFNAISLLKDYKIKLSLAGEGEEKEKYENIIKSKSIDVELIPPQSDLTQFFYTADICILTSIRDPLPTFMLQSGLHCKPFIGSNVDGISEVIKNGENGLLFERKNEFELSQRIELFIKDKSLAEKCAGNLYRLVSEKYTEKTVIPEIEKIYKDLK
jgi:glycosyltransferase involved in cell wall biosynthesis